MKNFKKIDKLILLEILSLILTVIFCMFKLVDISLIMSVVSSIFLITITRDLTDSYFNVPFIFVCFHILYGLSGPISIVWGNGLSSSYGYNFEPSPYMIAYSLCTIGLLFGIYLFTKKHKNKTDENKVENKEIKNYFIFVAVCGFAITFIFELINFFRVGGLDTMLQGKAIYQAAVDELKLTLPTQLISQVSLASLGVYMVLSFNNKSKISKKLLLICIAFSIPYLALILFLGRRGVLLSYMLIIMLALFQYKPLKKLNLKFILILLVAYFSLASLYAIRDYSNLIFTDFSEFTSKVFNKKNIIKSLNPGMNEFGCTFGNFNKLYISGDYEFLYGKSYIQGLTHSVPSYLYPGKKPQMITYALRDKYFSFKAEISSIASTAFSSILETYWNFGYFGALIYVLYGYAILYLDKILKKKNSFMLLAYMAVSPFVYSFHRSDFGHITSEFILIGGMVLFIYLFYKEIYNKDIKISKFIKKVFGIK